MIEGIWVFEKSKAKAGAAFMRTDGPDPGPDCRTRGLTTGLMRLTYLHLLLIIMAVPVPFAVSFPPSEIDRMLSKVNDTRLPSDPIVPGAAWDYGIDLDWLKQLKATWEKKWSWDETLESINKYVCLVSI